MVRRAAAALALAPGCTGPAPPPGDTCDPAPAVELGTGSDTFAPVTDGQTLALVFGPQGGFHVPLAVRGCGLGPVTTHATADRVADRLRFVDVTLEHDWRYADACCGVLLDVKGYVFSEVPGFTPAELDGAEVALGIEVADRAGETLTDARTVVIAYVAPQ